MSENTRIVPSFLDTTVVPKACFRSRTYTVFTLPTTFDPKCITQTEVLDGIAESVTDMCGLNHLTPHVEPIGRHQWMIVFWYGEHRRRVMTYEIDHPGHTSLTPCEKVVFIIDWRNGLLYLSDKTQREMLQKQTLCATLRPFFFPEKRRLSPYDFVPFEFDFFRLQDFTQEERHPSSAYPWANLILKGYQVITPGAEGRSQDVKLKGDGFNDEEALSSRNCLHMSSVTLHTFPSGKPSAHHSIRLFRKSNAAKVTLNGATLDTMAHLVHKLEKRESAPCF